MNTAWPSKLSFDVASTPSAESTASFSAAQIGELLSLPDAKTGDFPALRD